MKTLNEVIEAIEVCRNSYVAGKIIKSDALHYLKEYRDLKNALDAERVKTIVAYCQWQDAKEKLEAQTSQMMWVDKHFQFEISDNPPLTWDELKQMVGKPVWIEPANEWILISFTEENRIFFIEMTCNEYSFPEEDYPERWQAYKKERK